VFGPGAATRIYVALGAIDLRKGFDGFYGLVRDKLGWKSGTRFPAIRGEFALTTIAVEVIGRVPVLRRR
jgi:hypothetical protein